MKEGALQAKGDSHWAKGDALQAEGQASQLGGVGGQHMPDAAEPKAAGDSTQSPGDRVQQHESSTGSMQAHSLSDDSGPSKEPEQPQEQGKAKTPVRRVRVLRYSQLQLTAILLMLYERGITSISICEEVHGMSEYSRSNFALFRMSCHACGTS